MSGRTGSFTYRQSRGQTIVSQYQPLVKNPNTKGQQVQRARFKLMSQLASIMAPGFGTIGVTTRAHKLQPSQRNAFMQINFPLVEVATNKQEVTATIPMEHLQLTSSFRSLPNLSLSGDGEVLAEMRNIPSEVTTIRLVLVGYSRGQAELLTIADVPVDNSEISYAFPGITPVGKYTVLAYGLIPSESAISSIDLDNIHTPADEDFISAVQLNAMVANGMMAETMTVGGNVTVANIED